VIKFQKGFIHLFLLIVLALVVVGGIGFYAYKNGQLGITPSQRQISISPTPDLTADWKTYVDDYFDFEIKYPSDWQFTKNETNWEYGMQFVWAISPDIIKKDDEGRVIEGVSFNVAIHDSKQTALEELVKVVKDGGGIESSYTVNGISGILLYQENSPFKNSKRKVFVAQKGEIVYSVELVWSKQKPEAEKVLDQILSTFKFIE